VADLSHRDAEDAEGFHEIQLSGKQLVFLFMATTVVSVVIFLCGVLVGRGVKTDRPDDAAAMMAAPAPETAAPQPVAQTGPPAAEPPVPAGDSAEPEDDFTYARRLESDKPPADKLETPREATRRDAAAPPATAPAPKPAPKTAETAATAGARPGEWVVQLVALKDRSAASAIATRLSGKGYPAFVVSPPKGSPSIYRVQVGRYHDRREAEQVARRLEKEEQFKPWISH
jgi:cell division septation protein DedD